LYAFNLVHALHHREFVVLNGFQIFAEPEASSPGVCLAFIYDNSDLGLQERNF